MELFTALNGVSLKFGVGGVRAGAKRADKVQKIVKKYNV